MKLHIYGASGSGVTTLGQALSGILHYPYFDCDDFFWEKSDPPFTVRRNYKFRNCMLFSNLMRHEHWILGGSMFNWGWTPRFDLVVFLWIPPEIRMERLKAREYERYGDVIFTDPFRNKLYTDFIEWAKGYDPGIVTNSSRTLAAHEHWMKTLTCPILEIREDVSVEKRVKLIFSKMKEMNLTLEHIQ